MSAQLSNFMATSLLFLGSPISVYNLRMFCTLILRTYDCGGGGGGGWSGGWRLHKWASTHRQKSVWYYLKYA